MWNLCPFYPRVGDLLTVDDLMPLDCNTRTTLLSAVGYDEGLARYPHALLAQRWVRSCAQREGSYYYCSTLKAHNPSTWGQRQEDPQVPSQAVQFIESVSCFFLN